MNLDIEFLENHNLMDYSLLIKVEKMDNDQIRGFDKDSLLRTQFIS